MKTSIIGEVFDYQGRLRCLMKASMIEGGCLEILMRLLVYILA